MEGTYQLVVTKPDGTTLTIREVMPREKALTEIEDIKNQYQHCKLQCSNVHNLDGSIDIDMRLQLTGPSVINGTYTFKGSFVKGIVLTFYRYDEGYEAGDVCQRNGCLGIIAEGTKEGSGCYCHTGCAPCGWCTQQKEYCPECGWEAQNA